MKIPLNATIAEEKLSKYLLIFRPRNDKSKFLNKAGFFIEDTAILKQAIRRLIANNDAEQDRQDEYGIFFQVTGRLIGPSGELLVTTVWIKEIKSEQYRFVTLKPA